MSSYNDRLTSIYKDLQSILASSGGSCPWTINEDETITFNQLNIYSDSMYGSVLTDTKGLWVNTPTLYFGSKENPILELSVDTNGLKLSQNNYLYLYDKTYKIGYEYVDGSHDKIHLGPLYYVNNDYFYLTPVDLRIASSTIQWDDGLHLSKDGAIYGYGSDDHEWHIDFPSNGYFQIYDVTPSSNHVLTSNGTHLAIGNSNGKVIILPSSDGALENSGAFYFTTEGLYGGSENRWSIVTDAEYNTTFNVYSNLNLTSSGGGLRISCPIYYGNQIISLDMSGHITLSGAYDSPYPLTFYNDSMETHINSHYLHLKSDYLTLDSPYLVISQGSLYFNEYISDGNRITAILDSNLTDGYLCLQGQNYIKMDSDVDFQKNILKMNSFQFNCSTGTLQQNTIGAPPTLTFNDVNFAVASPDVNILFVDCNNE